MNIILFDSVVRQALLPLTYTRPVADLRIGSLTIAEKWARQTDGQVSFLTQDYLEKKFPHRVAERNLFIDGSILPSVELLSFLDQIENNTAYFSEGEMVVASFDRPNSERFIASRESVVERRLNLPNLPLFRITRPSDLFSLNDRAIREDFELLTSGRTSAGLPPSNLLIGPADQLFIEAGVTAEGCSFNTSSGPIYIGRDAVILEGGNFRGPIAVNAGAVIKMGAKIYGPTTIGDHCKVGGEINNVVFQANSNKGHDGFLGNAAIGEWCNIGADTNASNLKNDYSEVKVWSYPHGERRPSGLQFHGLIMGDHSKAGINTMFNTGTVVGVSASIFGPGFQADFIPSFTWGGKEDNQTYRLDKAIATVERVMLRRNVAFTDTDRAVLQHIFTATQKYRP
ncbi:UDP-N-acetylglucosamine diphosphorylase/glucosamine-1-phosphate N-acetyltransferase [Lewinella aquimaris]|uniref:UDP-N-acetylglucosamine diphosphorylase/glucosamine-1-phosphate N-acetyltransferase n=1 Tax=Neolewinella aquimaris TaxID=1835722 RepID=A0A840E8Y2_9BACT|nr:GlmU family protein [Neolewinella aquimaris]MBB4077516.1 UDP-N-acetylglucosamine diphosphorylase/glucosamine-1-phosphate N-acetyltransferase [Neolewinella aquimaris]